MRIVAIREATVPIGTAMRNAVISFQSMTASALAIVTDRVVGGAPLIGYAFDSIGRYGKGGLLRERFIPRLLAAPPESLQSADGLIDPELCWRVAMTDEKDGGHGERSGAVGLLDAALWDLLAKAKGQPLWRTLAERYATADATALIQSYGSCGHFQADGDAGKLRDEVKRARDLGYRTVKIKVDGRDLRGDALRIEAALSVLPAAELAVDANGKADMTDLRWMNMVAGYGLAWIEEPASPLDYAGLARLAAESAVPLATGENLFSWDDARNLLRYGGLRPARDRIQVDMLLAYGIPEYRRILAGFEAAGWQRSAFWPHAGHLFAAHVVAGLGLGSHEAAPDAGRVYGGFWDGTAIADGKLRIPDIPGVGYEAKANLYGVLRELVPDATAPLRSN
jgi:L-alanine-DL-glutamate epimerase-like enolase superfamily enzyme